MAPPCASTTSPTSAPKHSKPLESAAASQSRAAIIPVQHPLAHAKIAELRNVLIATYSTL
jgi:hypothetical protein